VPVSDFLAELVRTTTELEDIRAQVEEYAGALSVQSVAMAAGAYVLETADAPAQSDAKAVLIAVVPVLQRLDGNVAGAEPRPKKGKVSSAGAAANGQQQQQDKDAETRSLVAKLRSLCEDAPDNANANAIDNHNDEEPVSIAAMLQLLLQEDASMSIRSQVLTLDRALLRGAYIALATMHGGKSKVAHVFCDACGAHPCANTEASGLGAGQQGPESGHDLRPDRAAGAVPTHHPARGAPPAPSAARVRHAARPGQAAQRIVRLL
jgi:hypothetical protein